ncbi:MAG TPA: hypothetical protein EYQ31_08575 [Candidatus Handelsmanbacteria bacterium]|nr:hypothetical protein [Candidatus Handelsmanbacteria bacterium]
MLALIGYPGRVEAGAWAQPQGERYLKFSIISYDADKHFDGDGDKQALGTMDDSFHAEQGFLYAEYGALNRLTVIGQTSWSPTAVCCSGRRVVWATSSWVPSIR